jgi:hypothetical protein
LLTVIATTVYGQSNVSLVSAVSENYYLSGLLDTYYSCDEEGNVTEKNTVVQFTEETGGGIRMRIYNWNGTEWKSSSTFGEEGILFHATNIGNTYFLETNTDEEYPLISYDLTNGYLIIYEFNPEEKKLIFSSTTEYRNFIANNLNNITLFNRIAILKKFSVENDAENFQAEFGALVVNGLIDLIFGGDTDSNSTNTYNQEQNNNQRAFQVGKDYYGNPIYEDRFGNKVDSYGNQYENH